MTFVGYVETLVIDKRRDICIDLHKDRKPHKGGLLDDLLDYSSNNNTRRDICIKVTLIRVHVFVNMKVIPSTIGCRCRKLIDRLESGRESQRLRVQVFIVCMYCT